MVAQSENITLPEIVYPDSDGQPIADNTIQFRWITTIKTNLDWLFAQDDQVFVAGDLLWYAVEGNDKKRIAPDVMVVFGRPKGARGSYRQWLEDNIAPQVVFEILSPGNTQQEMSRKLLFYESYGVEEYYIYDPNKNEITGLIRGDEGLKTIEDMNGWISTRLKIRFEVAEPELILYHPNGAPRSGCRRPRFTTTFTEERQRADKLAAKLKELGVNVDEI